MFALIDALAKRLAREPAVLVRVHATEGSVPREAGAWMAVMAGDVIGTIGGGHLEFEAIAQAREKLAAPQVLPAPAAPSTPSTPSAPSAPSAQLANSAQSAPASTGPEIRRQALGPSLGQCCGGVVHLAFEPLGPQDAAGLRARLAPALAPLALFGGGHVGRALVNVLSTLPYAITWVDSREGVFPDGLPPQVRCEHSEPVQDAVDGLAPGSAVLVMSFSHAEDLDIVAACLRRQRARADLDFIGLIGSRTKWATFRHRLGARGFTEAELAGITCPIGLPGLVGKEPEVIAVSVAAQLLMRRQVASPQA